MALPPPPLDAKYFDLQFPGINAQFKDGQCVSVSVPQGLDLVARRRQAHRSLAVRDTARVLIAPRQVERDLGTHGRRTRSDRLPSYSRVSVSQWSEICSVPISAVCALTPEAW